MTTTEGTSSQMDAITKDSPQWRAALTLAPEKYQPFKLGFQQVPPAITPDLLYAILEAGLKCEGTFWQMVWSQFASGGSLADAIIRAAASLQEVKC